MDIKTIKEVVSETMGVNLNDTKAMKSRTVENVDTRMLYFYLCRQYTSKSLAELGRSLKPTKDHATVLHNIRTVEDRIRFDKRISEKYKNIRSRIEFIKHKEQQGIASFNYTQALQHLFNLEEQNKELLETNKNLLKEIDEISERIKRQDKYLKEAGYIVNKRRSY